MICLFFIFLFYFIFFKNEVKIEEKINKNQFKVQKTKRRIEEKNTSVRSDCEYSCTEVLKVGIGFVISIGIGE